MGHCLILKIIHKKYQNISHTLVEISHQVRVTQSEEIPWAIVNEDGLVTLDDMTLDQLSNEIGTPVVVSEDTPQSFFSLLN